MAKLTLIFLSLILLSAGMPAHPASMSETAPKSPAVSPETSPVILDGKELLSVPGFKAISSEERAKAIGKRIRKVAEDLSLRSDSITTAESDVSTDVVAGDQIIMSVTDKDSQAAGRARQDLAGEYAEKIKTAVVKYRADYSRKSILSGILYSLAATAAFILILILLIRVFRRVNNLIETKYKDRIHAVHLKSVEIVQAQRVRALVGGIVRLLRFLIIGVIIYSYLHFLLSFFPWTRPFANQLLGYLLVPVKVIGGGVIKQIPNLLFIAVLAVIVLYGLKFMHVFFKRVEQGTIAIEGFYPEWARPTHRLLSLLVVAFAVIVAFPYIPGSDSPAFKGVSIFIGVLFSLGSQSAVSNIIGGLVMTYRRAFKVGDRVQIGEITGDVTEIRLQLTHIRTIKNEDVIVPNSAILSSNVKNYSSLAREKGLILHTTVTIGYDAPWRQVHELLLMAAARTPGLQHEPPPFVLQKSLEDFYVRYELNAYTDTPQGMAQIYSELHENIQDCFNEYGVQIMSPNYEADRAVPTIVPKNRWYAPPAKPPIKEDSPNPRSEEKA